MNKPIKLVRVPCQKDYHSFLLILPIEYVGKEKSVIGPYILKKYNAARKDEGRNEVASLPRGTQYLSNMLDIRPTKSDEEYWKRIGANAQDVLDNGI
jgi:hypothetical protein